MVVSSRPSVKFWKHYHSRISAPQSKVSRWTFSSLWLFFAMIGVLQNFSCLLTLNTTCSPGLYSFSRQCRRMNTATMAKFYSWKFLKSKEKLEKQLLFFISTFYDDYIMENDLLSCHSTSTVDEKRTIVVDIATATWNHFIFRCKRS